MGGDLAVGVGGDRATHVHGSEAVTVDGDYQARNAGARVEKIAGTEEHEVGESRTTTIHGDEVLWVDGFLSTAVGLPDAPADAQLSVDGRHTILATKRIHVTSETELVLSCGESTIVLGPKEIRIRSGSVGVEGLDDVLLRSKGPTLHLTDAAELLAGEVRLYSTGASLELGANANLNGAQLKLNCGPGSGAALAAAAQQAKLKPLEMRLCDSAMTPFANKHYRLAVGQVRLEGTTDGDGWVRAEVPAEAEAAQLTFWKYDFPTGERAEWLVKLETKPLPPPTSLAGALLRLNHLGYYDGPPQPLSSTPEVEAALKAFQEATHIQVTGILDGQTSAKIKEVHGS